MEKIDLLLKNFDSLKKEFKIVSQQLKEENKELFNTIVENSTNLIAVIQEGKFIFVNTAGLNLFHAKSSTEIIGKDINEIINPVCHHAITERLKKISKNSKDTLNIKFERSDKSVISCQCDLVSFQYNKKQAILLTGRDITNKLRQQVKLQSKEKLRTDILNAFQDVIALYAPDHSIIWLNNAAKKQLNIQDDSYIGELCYKKWFNADKPCKTCPVVTRTIKPLERIITFDNGSIWRITHTPLFNDKGILTGYIEFRTDITEKQRIKIELEKSHAKQIRAELTNSFGHFEIDLSTKRHILSPGTFNILGLAYRGKRTTSNINFFKYVHSDDSSEVYKYLDLAYSGEKKFDRIFKIIDENCIEKTIRGVGEVKTDAVTGNRKFFAVVQDITRISNLEKLVFDEREKYKMLAENAPFGLILTQNDKPVYINKTLFEWFGIESISEFEKKGFANFFLPGDKRVAQQLSQKIKENNIPLPVVEKLRFINREGNITYVRLDLKNNTIHGQNYIQIVFTDITDDVIKEKKQKQIAADALYINQKNSILSEIESVLTKILTQTRYLKSIKDFDKIYSIINSYKLVDKDWKMLIANFEEVHPGFFSRLKKMYPKLSTVDIKHCTCIKMNMDTKEIARFFNIKITSVQIARVRIKKKMDLPRKVDLRSYILDF